jgi:hypothetical protein
MLKRIKAALRTNDIQVGGVVFLSAMMVMASLHGERSWWVTLFAALVWPAVAFIANLFDPFPKGE